MIVGKCPLRVSLVGGSTDLIDFVKEYGMGSVISFPINMYTYILLSYNHHNQYRINYLNSETVSEVNEIRNDVAREVIKYFDLPPVTIVFNTDISSTGSGLASSSSYTIALVATVNKLLNLNLSQFEICKTALDIEHKFNPLTGYQDSYGCGLGGLKRLFFYEDKVISKSITSKIFNNINLYLLNTNSIRSSNKILLSVNFKKVSGLLKSVENMESAINNKADIYGILNSAWHDKKKTSKSITSKEVDAIEKRLEADKRVKAFKLCGAGGGGYFLVLTEEKIRDSDFLDIKIDSYGVSVSEI
jgi:D-glycero-alpha-D-manno-heptose-7-phosphate kinase